MNINEYKLTHTPTPLQDHFKYGFLTPSSQPSCTAALLIHMRMIRVLSQFVFPPVTVCLCPSSLFIICIIVSAAHHYSPSPLTQLAKNRELRSKEPLRPIFTAITIIDAIICTTSNKYSHQYLYSSSSSSTM